MGSDYEVLKEFLASFGDTNQDGRISREEFRAYYDGVSAFIDQDGYFELMLRNSFHLAGGVGQSANTSNLRVCATFQDGHDEWLTVEDDLGLNLRSRNAASEIMARLKQQGYRGIVTVDWRGSA